MNLNEHRNPAAARDADRATLHIRCGSDIRMKLQEANFSGAFMEYSDPVCQGPVPNAADLLARRAQFLHDAFGTRMGLTAAQLLARLEDEQNRLSAAHRYERVVLWFEHDSHDQLILARCLAHFAGGLQPAHLELICIDRHPSVQRFIGLGQLDAAALASLWPHRTTVSRAQLDLGAAIWIAVRHADPLGLAAIAATGTPILPSAAPALFRHLEELPGTVDGLSRTERIVLRIVADRPAGIGDMFAALMHGREPLPFLGDLGFLYTVEQMAATRPAVITIEPAEKPFRALASITEIGRQVLAGQVDYLSLHPPERWIGGVPADGRWRWHEFGGGIVQAA